MEVMVYPIRSGRQSTEDDFRSGRSLSQLITESCSSFDDRGAEGQLSEHLPTTP